MLRAIIRKNNLFFPKVDKNNNLIADKNSNLIKPYDCEFKRSFYD